MNKSESVDSMCKVLVVDDDPIVRLAHQSMLAKDFEVASIGSGNEVLDYFDEQSADVILLDVGLPDIDGFEVCRRLEQGGKLEQTSVIFVSGSTDLDTRIKAFNSGGDDFIAKPLNPDELMSKVDVLKKRKEHNLSICEKLLSAQRIASRAESTSSGLGRVMDFVALSFSLHSVESLTKSVLELFATFELKVVMLTEVNGRYDYFSYEGEIKPIERELIDLLKNKGRVYEFNQRMQLNYPHISVLIKNMPDVTDERYARLKDLLPAIASCMSSRLTEMDAQENILLQTQELVHSFDVINATLKTLTSSLGSNQQKASRRLHKMVYELHGFIQRLGLEDDQEERVMHYVDDAVEDSLVLLDDEEAIFHAFEEILASLKETVEKQNRVIAQVTHEKRLKAEVLNADLN